jgi:hypothetical protein
MAIANNEIDIINNSVQEISRYVQTKILSVPLNDKDLYLPYFHGKLSQHSSNYYAGLLGVDVEGYGIFPGTLFDILLDSEYLPDMKGILVFTPPILMMNVHYGSASKMNMYRNWLSKVFQTYIPGQVDLNRTVEDIVQFEISIQRIMVSSDAKRDQQLNPRQRVKTSDLLDRFPNIFGGPKGTEAYFTEYLEIPKVTFYTLNIYIPNLDFFTQLNQLLGTISLSSLQNYFAYLSVIQMATISALQGVSLPLFTFKDLPSGSSMEGLPITSLNLIKKGKNVIRALIEPQRRKMEAASFIPVEILSPGVQIQTKGYKSSSTSIHANHFCGKDVLRKYNVLTAIFYKELTVSAQSDNLLKILTSDLSNAFFNRVSNPEDESWLDDKSRKLLLNKLEKIQYRIAIPEDFHSESYISTVYKGLIVPDNLGSRSFLMDGISLVSNTNLMPFRLWLNHYNTMVNILIDWTQVNAFYYPPLNVVVLPMGFLHPIVFNNDYPLAVHYGTIGAIIGHELTHGFDNSGIKYNEYGAYDESWFPSKVKTVFDYKAHCFSQYYSEFKFENVSINGNTTLGENIADNGGIKTAWDAFKDYQKRRQKLNLPKETMLGLEAFSEEQLFFISYAQLWCAVQDPDSTIFDIYNDEHTINRIRVNAGVNINQNFETTFDCPVKDDRCSLWKRDN